MKTDDFLADYERVLHAAAIRYLQTPSYADGTPVQRVRGRRLSRVVVPSLALVAAALAIVFVVLDRGATGPRDEVVATPSATATPVATEPAAIGTWKPTLGRPRLGITASIDHTPVAQPVVDALAVLRRPQSDRDRELAGPKLRYVGNGVDRVQIDGVRALSPNYALVPVQQFAPEPGVGPGICLMGSGGAGCAPVATVAERGVSGTSAGQKGTHFVGIVPDGIARVRFTPAAGRPIQATVTENFYELRYGHVAPPTRMTPPSGWKGPVGDDGKIEGGPMPARGRLEWLDASGKVVGPK
jgi:hypothetical protein